MITVVLLFALSIILTVPLCGSQTSDQSDKVHVIMVPTAGNEFTHGVIKYGVTPNNASYAYYRNAPDCGHRKGVGHFLKLFNGDPEVATGNRRLILYGVCLGAETIFNSIPHMNEEHRKRIQLILLEGMPANRRNSADHSAQYGLFLPFSRVWVPLIALGYNFAYNPCAQGPSRMLEYDLARNLPSDAAVVMMHDVYDSCTPISDIVQLKGDLLQHHKNTFLVPTHHGDHIGLLSGLKEKERAVVFQQIREIYLRCNIPVSPLLDRYACDESQQCTREKNGHSVLIHNSHSYHNESFLDVDETDMAHVVQRQLRVRKRARCIRNVVDVATILGIVSWKCFEKYKAR